MRRTAATMLATMATALLLSACSPGGSPPAPDSTTPATTDAGGSAGAISPEATPAALVDRLSCSPTDIVEDPPEGSQVMSCYEPESDSSIYLYVYVDEATRDAHVEEIRQDDYWGAVTGDVWTLITRDQFIADIGVEEGGEIAVPVPAKD